MTGALKLCRFILRSDWFKDLIWLVALGVFAVAIPLIFEGMFGTDAERMAMAETMQNPAMTALLGKGYGFDNFTTGAMMADEMLLLTMMAVAIANIFMVIKHTRKAEELGRLEMIQSFPVGRYANLTAVLVIAFLFDVAVVILHTVLYTALNIESMPFIGNLTFSLCVGITGFFFAALTAVVVQITSSSRMATGISFALFMLAYMMRAVGDLGNEVLSLASPLGLALRAKPYVDEDPLPLIILFAAALVVCVPAYLLQGHRDMDEGLIPQRPGKAHASKSLLSPLGLAWRLNRGTFFAWAIGLFCIGAMYGSVFGSLESFLDSSDLLKAILSNSQFTLTEQFLAMLMVVLSIMATVPALLFALKLRAEEKEGRTDNLLTKNVSRAQLMTSYLIISVISCVVMLLMITLGLWVAETAVMTSPISFETVFIAGFSYLPAMLVMCGFGLALTGWLPRITWVAWALLFYGIFSGYLAKVMQLDERVGIITPFYYVKQYPVQDFKLVPLLALCGVAVALTVVGYIGYRRRDLD